MLTLYQFPISHYCEKIRWALDYKGLDYKIVNLLPGSHVKTIQKMAPRTEVPVLEHDGRFVQNSSDIITYLDEHFPDPPLTPASPELQAQALEWESYADEQIGPQIRLFCYYYFLDRPDILLPMLTLGQPWYKRLLFRLIYPKVRTVIRRFLHINQRTAATSLVKLTGAIDRLHGYRQQHPFLAGDNFSRADLAAAALLAPLCRPDKYGLEWPAVFPGEMAASVDALRPKLTWVEELYRTRR
jgi:glutathione S-transferase